MLKNFILFIFTSTAFFCGCTNNDRTNSAVTSHIAVKNLVKPNKVNVQLTDSAKLVKQLDSLPKAVLPQNVTELSSNASNINLSEFKNRSLFNIPFKRIPRQIGGAGIDMNGNNDSTFNLCDTNYKANWVLVTKTPNFFVVEMKTNYTLLVTIDYQLNIIDAIHIAAGDPTSNDNFQGELTSTIYKNLKVVLHYTYYLRTDAERHFDATTENDIWRVDMKGRFKAIRYRPDGAANF